MPLRVEQMLRAPFAHPAGHQARHFALRLLHRDARFQPADHGKKVRTTTAGVCRIELERHEQLDLIVAPRRKCKVGWHHTDDGSCFRVDLNLFADDVVCAAETLLPETMRNDRDVWSTIA